MTDLRTIHLVGWLLVLFASAGAAPGQQAFNVAEARKAVVFIRRVTPGHEVALGSGFLISSDGLIYTSRHVIEPKDRTSRGTIMLVGVPSRADPDDLDWFQALAAYSAPEDEHLDFAILKIATKPEYGTLPALPLSYDKLELGAPVAVIGYPYIRDNEAVLSFNKGSVSSTRVRFSGKSYYQTDAAVNQGNSGGPLLNVKGEAVGIITLKEVNAENVGFALYLAEIRQAAASATRHAGDVRPTPGPIDPRRLELPITIAPRAANWRLADAHIRDEGKHLVVDNLGAPFWLTSRAALPENFQLVISCALEHLQGGQKIGTEQRKNLRRLYVRFGTAATDVSIEKGGGYLLLSSHASTTLYRGARVLKGAPQGNPQAKLYVDGISTFRLSITKLGREIEVAMDGKVLFTCQDDSPLDVHKPFSIGGYLCRLHLGDVTVIDLAKVPKSPADEPPAPAE